MSPHARHRFGLPMVAAGLFGLLGCGGAPSEKRAAPAAAPDASEARLHREREAQPAGAEPPPPPAGPAAAPARKIIFTANLDVVVKDLKEAWAAAEKLVAENKGYVAKSEVRSDAGSRRTGAYTLRVPVDRFPAVLGALKDLGIPERDATDSQDVTEEYVDTQARVATLRKEEEALRGLLDKAKTPAEMLPIRKELLTVRTDIERAEGRLKYLSALSAFSTIHLTLREVTDYKPPTAPTFGSRVGGTFGASWDAVVGFGEAVVLLVVALTPWLPLLVPAGVLIAVVIRRSRRELTRARPVARRPRPVEESPPPPAVAEGEPPG